MSVTTVQCTGDSFAGPRLCRRICSPTLVVMTTTTASSPVGLHRVLEPAGVLPQAAWRLETDPALADDEVRVRVERLNLDAASFRQLFDKHAGDGDAVRAEVLEIIRTRGKMHNRVSGSGGI